MGTQVQINWLFFTEEYMHVHKHIYRLWTPSGSVGVFFLLGDCKASSDLIKAACGVREPSGSIQCPESRPEQWVRNTQTFWQSKKWGSFRGWYAHVWEASVVFCLPTLCWALVLCNTRRIQFLFPRGRDHIPFIGCACVTVWADCLEAARGERCDLLVSHIAGHGHLTACRRRRM